MFIFSHFLSLACIPKPPSKATYQPGIGANLPCIFPFKYKGKTCAGPQCCNPSNDPKGSWCSTKVDGEGNYLGGHYAYCKGSTCDPG